MGVIVWLKRPDSIYDSIDIFDSYTAPSGTRPTSTFYEGLTSSYVLIFIGKVNLNVLYKALYLSRSIRPNKAVKIACEN